MGTLEVSFQRSDATRAYSYPKKDESPNKFLNKPEALKSNIDIVTR
jgi:hypothetical protein